MHAPLWQLALALVAGLALGFVYFGGLWLTVRRVPRSRNPQLLVFGSFVLRLGVTVAALVLLARVHWQLALAAMAALVATRIVLVRRLRPGPRAPTENTVTEQ